MRSDSVTSGQEARPSFIEQARRAQIVAAAVEVIAGAGYGRTSLAAIAQHAGISKGVISYHFRGGKDELMTAVVETVYLDAGTAVVERVKAVDSAAEQVRTYVIAAAEYMRAHPSSLAALGQIFANLRTADGEPRYGMHTSEPLFTGLEHLYRRGVELGEFRDVDLRVVAVTHQAAIDAMFGYWAVHPELDLDAYARSLGDLLVHAVEAAPTVRTDRENDSRGDPS